MVDRDDVLRGAQLGSLAMAVLLAGLGAAVGSGTWFALAGAALAAGIGVAVSRAFSAVDARLHRSGRWVVLSGVADAFVEAVAAEGRAVDLRGGRDGRERVDRPSVRT